MSTVPTFATRPSFLGIEHSSSDAAIRIAGIPFDLGTSSRPGARFGPNASRQASRMLVDGDHPASWAEIEAMDLADIGDFRTAHGDIPATLAKIEKQAAGIEHLVALGGDHTITIALLRALARQKGPAGAAAFRRACRHLAGKVRPCLGPRLGVLSRNRRRPRRPASYDPGRHSLAAPPRYLRMDRQQRCHDRFCR